MNRSYKTSRHHPAIGLMMAALIGFTASVAKAELILGSSAQSFAVLGAETVTNTGPSVISGNVGVTPGSAITGFFPPGVVVDGTLQVNTGPAITAKSEANAAYVALAGLEFDDDMTGVDLGGLTLTSGVYFFSSSAQLTGQLTLDGQNLENPFFVFQIGSTLTTASASSLLMINGLDACSVYFQLGSSATIGTGTQMAGNILALASITMNTGATLDGRLFALTGAVTSIPIPSLTRTVMNASLATEAMAG